MSDCLINKTKRLRVKGDGPGREEFLTFAKIGDAPDELVQRLNDIVENNKNNDLGGDNYNISQLCDVEGVFSPKNVYRQVLIQEKSIEGDSVDEHVYTKYAYEVPEIPFFENIYRLRISEMKPNHEMNWHIDTDTSVLCRAQICLNDNDSVFEFNRRNKIEKFQMKKGEIWFINTGWLHRVVSGSDMRRSAIFGFDFKDYNGNIHILRD